MIQEIKDKETYLQFLTDDFISTINEAISAKGSAKILLSGGSSPVEFYERLSNIKLPWEKIHVGLVDERFVEPTDENSNTLLLRNNLLKNHAKKASFSGLVVDSEDIIENWNKVEKLYETFLHADYLLLGMGEDGHTASIFPNDINSDLTFETDGIIAITNAPKYPFKRITCTPKMIRSSSHIVLMLAGEKKRKVFEEADTQNLPISKFNEYIHKTFLLI